jgi:hypothetical protein
MTSRLIAAVAVVGLAASLAGCSIAPDAVPDPPTVDETLAFHDMMLDKTWAKTGLEGRVQRPTVRVGPILAPNDWSSAISDCMQGLVVDAVGWSYSSTEGYQLLETQPDADPYADEVELGWYVCIAQHPLDAGVDGTLRSPAQAAYLYQYFQRWLVPCLEAHGVAVADEPTRAQFLTNGMSGDWNPYFTLRGEPPGGFDRLLQQCGAPTGVIPGLILGG